jgi:hypothetical protein
LGFISTVFEDIFSYLPLKIAVNMRKRPQIGKKEGGWVSKIVKKCLFLTGKEPKS